MIRRARALHDSQQIGLQSRRFSRIVEPDDNRKSIKPGCRTDPPVIRIDDAKEDGIRRRWEVYECETRPVLDCYPADIIHEVDAMGSPGAFQRALEPFNTAPDGGERSTGTLPLFGPGIVVEIPLGQESLTQALITVTDQDIAWPVLSRMCRELGWKMMDVGTGQTFG